MSKSNDEKDIYFKEHRFNYYEKLAFNQQFSGSILKGGDKVAAPTDILYGINDTPPIYMAIFLGVQHYLTMFGSTVAVPLLLAPYLCIEQNTEALSDLIGTIFFVSGIATLVQVLIGTRLPIIQGATFAFIQPTIQILTTQEFKCSTNSTANSNISDTNDWRKGMREIQGAIILASVFQIFVGLTGIIGLLMKFIGPITIATTVILIGISLVKSVGEFASDNWSLAFMNLCCITGFSQIIKKRNIFKIFPVFISLLLTCSVSAVLTKVGVIQTSSTTNIFGWKMIKEAKWFKLPQPYQWGRATFSVTSFGAILMGTIVSTIESIGNYIACAEIAGISRPPKHAINRGIAVEGIMSLLAGVWGSGCGTTSYSENIAAIGVTKVASRMVIVIGAFIMIILSVIGKFGALFLLIPKSVVGGMFWALFGAIISVGLSSLHYVNLKSNRNLFVLGFSLYNGMVVPDWVLKNIDSINTGNQILDEVLRIFLTTHMMIGACTCVLLDNILPNDKAKQPNTKYQQRNINYKNFDNIILDCEEDFINTTLSPKQKIKSRFSIFYKIDGYSTFKNNIVQKLGNVELNENISRESIEQMYSLPLPFQRYLNKKSWVRYFPFLPYHPSLRHSDDVTHLL